MKKVSILFLVAILFSTLTISSCKKDDPEPEPPTKTELLTDGIWEGVKLEEYTNGALEYTELIPETSWEFKSNKTGTTYYQGAQEDIFTWDFNSDESKLILEFTSDWIMDIETLTDKSLVLSETYAPDDVTYKDVLTFKRD